MVTPTKSFYFGTVERMSWVPCPAINAGIGVRNWSEDGNYLSGGAWVNRSVASARQYSFSWNPMPNESLAKVLNYFDGLYGDGPFYFIDPFAETTNLLPAWLAAPRLAVQGAPSLVEDYDPTLITTPVNTLDYPTRGARYVLTSGSISQVYSFPIPEGHTLHIGAHGVSTGTAAITVNGTALTLLPVTSGTRTNRTVNGQGWADIAVTGVGNLDLYGIIAQVRPTSETVPGGGFIAGVGNSGVDFSNPYMKTGYSAALDNVGASIDLIEVGGWL